MTALAPRDRETIAALRTVAAVVDTDAAYWADGRFWFDLGDGWMLALAPDSGGRFRVAVWQCRREVDSLWCLARDLRRLADMAHGARDAIEALTSA